MTGERTRAEAIDRAATAYAQLLATCEQMTPREQAEAAWSPTSRFTVDQLEDQIRADRGMPPIHVCGAWNDGHDCRLEPDHTGDHECAACHDVWNRGPWDDDADEFTCDRPDGRCVDGDRLE